MNREYCIFKSKKPCDNCGECERCDLNSNKKCNNCGKCLEQAGFDMKGIKIDEVIESEGEAKDYQDEVKREENAVNSTENHYQLINDDKLEDFSDEDTDADFEELADDYTEEYKYEEESLDDVLQSEIFDDENIEYIDDIEGLREMLEDDEKISEIAYEEFPGFIRIKGRDGYNN